MDGSRRKVMGGTVGIEGHRERERWGHGGGIERDITSLFLPLNRVDLSLRTTFPKLIS